MYWPCKCMLSISHEPATGQGAKTQRPSKTGFHCRDLTGPTSRDRDKSFWVAGLHLLDMWACYCGSCCLLVTESWAYYYNFMGFFFIFVCLKLHKQPIEILRCESWAANYGFTTLFCLLTLRDDAGVCPPRFLVLLGSCWRAYCESYICLRFSFELSATSPFVPVTFSPVFTLGICSIFPCCICSLRKSSLSIIPAFSKGLAEWTF